MGLSIDLADDGNFAAARIKVVGVGGAGGNAIRSMIEAQVSDVEFVVANTDIQALAAHPADLKIQLGRNLTKGLGAGANPEIGKKAAMEDIQLIQEQLQGADMVFVTAGMGGGTGTGAAPVIAQVARDLGALTVGVVTKPFGFEGKRRGKLAGMGLDELANHVDSLITIPNDRLLSLEDGANLAFTDAFRKADDVLVNAVQSISDLIQQNGIVNVDFADVKAIMSSMGLALMGVGYGRGERRAMDAATAAINSPLLDDMHVDGATGILLNFMGGPDMKLAEVNEAASMIQAAASDDANIIFGVVINPEMRDIIKVTVIATGFSRAEETEQRVQPVSRGIIMPQPRPLVAPVQTGYSVNSMPQRIALNSAVPQSAPTTRAINGILGAAPMQSPMMPTGRSTVPPKAQPQPVAQPRPAGARASAVSMSEEEWDIPTFLRSRANEE
jgi:cell division protein FtsZ